MFIIINPFYKHTTYNREETIQTNLSVIRNQTGRRQPGWFLQIEVELKCFVTI